MKIILNARKCLRCFTICASLTRHDFRSCLCGDIFVDGGRDYLRSGVKDGAQYQDMSIILENGRLINPGDRDAFDNYRKVQEKVTTEDEIQVSA